MFRVKNGNRKPGRQRRPSDNSRSILLDRSAIGATYRRSSRSSDREGSFESPRIYRERSPLRELYENAPLRILKTTWWNESHISNCLSTGLHHVGIKKRYNGAETLKGRVDYRLSQRFPILHVFAGNSALPLLEELSSTSPETA